MMRRCLAGRLRRRAFGATLPILMLALAGCSSTREWWNNGFKVGPDYCAAKATVADSWIEASDPRLRSMEPNTACWWTAFGDPTLNQLVADASQQNLTLKMAGCRILQARAERGVAEGNLFPQQQSMAASYTRNAMSANSYPFNIIQLPSYYYDNWSPGFNAAWELDFWGRFRRAVEAADANLNAQVEGYDNVLVLLQADVAANYIQMRSYEERLELAKRNLDLQKETLRIATVRAEKGLVTELDVQQATTNLGRTESLIPSLQTGWRTAQNRLCILLGEPPASWPRGSRLRARFRPRRKRSSWASRPSCSAGGPTCGRPSGKPPRSPRGSGLPNRTSIRTSPLPVR